MIYNKITSEYDYTDDEGYECWRINTFECWTKYDKHGNITYRKTLDKNEIRFKN